MDMKKVLDLAIEVMRSDGIEWDSLTEDEQVGIITKLQRIRNELIVSVNDVIGIVSEKESQDLGEERVVHTQNGDVTITTF